MAFQERKDPLDHGMCSPEKYIIECGSVKIVRVVPPKPVRNMYKDDVHRLDLNCASTTAKLLKAKLPGLGDKLSEAVIQRRSSGKGEYTRVSQLKEVPGIGDKKFNDIAPFVTVCPRDPQRAKERDFNCIARWLAWSEDKCHIVMFESEDAAKRGAKAFKKTGPGATEWSTPSPQTNRRTSKVRDMPRPKELFQ